MSVAHGVNPDKTHPLFQIVISLVCHLGHDHQGSCNTNTEWKREIYAQLTSIKTLSGCGLTTRPWYTLSRCTVYVFVCVSVCLWLLLCGYDVYLVCPHILLSQERGCSGNLEKTEKKWSMHKYMVPKLIISLVTILNFLWRAAHSVHRDIMLMLLSSLTFLSLKWCHNSHALAKITRPCFKEAICCIANASINRS